MATTPWSQIKKRYMTTGQRNRAHKMAEREIAEIQLRQLREALKITQVELAKRLKVTQVAVSKLESRPDLRFSTLREYIRALGGQMEVRVKIGGRTVTLSHFGGRRSSGNRKHAARPASR